MKTLVLSMISIAATVAAMTACTSESDPVNEVIENNQPTPIVFGSSISEITTKTVGEADTKFANGDKVAITMYTSTTKAEPIGTALGEPKSDNVTFTSDASSKLTETTPTMFWERSAYHYFYAYYPVATTTGTDYIYTEPTGSTSGQITVKVKEDGTTTDLIMGSNTDGSKFEGTAPVTKLTFSHMMSKIKFVFKKDASYTKLGELTNISFKVNNESITYNLVNPGSGTPSVAAGVTLSKDVDYTIVANTNGDAITEWAPIVVPGSTVSDLSLKIDGATLTSLTIKDLELKAGYMTKIVITLKSSGPEFTSDINAWQDATNSGSTEVQ